VSIIKFQPLQQNPLIGFRSGFSCGSNLLSFLETITSLGDAKENVDAIFLDLAKAFDKVPHKRLLLELEAHGIGGLVSNWIKSWLADRRQRDQDISSRELKFADDTKLYCPVNSHVDCMRLQKDLDTVVVL